MAMHALFVVAKYAKGGIYSRQHYFKLSLNQCSLYCQVCKARRLFVCDFCPCHCKFSYSEQDRHGEVLSHVGGSRVHEILLIPKLTCELAAREGGRQAGNQAAAAGRQPITPQFINLCAYSKSR